MSTPTLVSTPGATNANSYCTVAEADAYHDARLNRADWLPTGSDAATKTVALIMGTRVLDSMYEWNSWAVQALSQSLQWPRFAMLRRNRLDYVRNDEIPVELKNATAELARQLIVEDRTIDNDVETQGLRALHVGSVGLDFKDGVTAKVIPDAVYSLLPPWWGTIVGRVTGMRVLERA